MHKDTPIDTGVCVYCSLVVKTYRVARIAGRFTVTC